MQTMRTGTIRNILLGILLPAALLWPGCEPSDTPGTDLEDIHLSLSGKTPSGDGHYIMSSGERAVIKATGTYGDGHQEDITLAMFWQLDTAEVATIECESDEVIGKRVILRALAAGTASVVAWTRNEEDTIIPCSPEPDGGWSFPDSGTDWPLCSDTLEFEVR